MIKSKFTVYSLQFTVRFPFTVFPGERLIVNSKRMVNGK